MKETGKKSKGSTSVYTAKDIDPSVDLSIIGKSNIQIPDNDNDIDYSDIYSNYQLEYNEEEFINKWMEKVVVIDGVPIVDESKRDKLLNVIKKKFASIGGIHDVFMPMDAKSGQSKGFLMMEFETEEQAAMAIKYADGLAFDSKHTFAVNMIADIDTFQKFPEVHTPPAIEPFKPKPHLKSWLMDDKARDQFVIMRAEDVGVYWNNKGDQPDQVHSRKNWSDMYVQWSPLGSYITTFHKQGVALWGGPDFEKIVRFAHPNVKLVDFSPNEKFLVTWSHEPVTTETGDLHHVIVWDIVTGEKLRSFPVDPSTLQPAEGAPKSGPGATVKIEWPLFKWSHDSKYIARMLPGKEGAISIYETPGMGLLDKKSIKIENLKSFEWSPTENILAHWTTEPEVGNIPARVTLIKVPTKEIVRTKNLFNVLSATMHWQSEGKFLLVKVERSKSKKQTVTNLEIFRMREKDVPVDVIEVKAGDVATGVWWEPKGDRYALITSEAVGAPKMTVHFYEMNLPAAPVAPTSGKKGAAAAPPAKAGASAAALASGAKLLKSLDRKGVNQVLWSPKGRIAVLAGVRGYQGELEFWDADDLVMLGVGEHYQCTDAEWDSSGRYLITSVSWWRVQTDPGFSLWTNTGVSMTKQTVPQFKQILWRPRPPTPLSTEEQKKVKKQLKELSKEFDEEDAKQSTKVNREVVEKRLALWNEWVSYRRRCFDDWKKEAPLRLEIVGFDLEEDARQGIREVEEYVDEVVDEVEEIVPDEDYGDD